MSAKLPLGYVEGGNKTDRQTERKVVTSNTEILRASPLPPKVALYLMCLLYLLQVRSNAGGLGGCTLA